MFASDGAIKLEIRLENIELKRKARYCAVVRVDQKLIYSSSKSSGITGISLPSIRPKFPRSVISFVLSSVAGSDTSNDEGEGINFSIEICEVFDTRNLEFPHKKHAPLIAVASLAIGDTGVIFDRTTAGRPLKINVKLTGIKYDGANVESTDEELGRCTVEVSMKKLLSKDILTAIDGDMGAQVPANNVRDKFVFGGEPTQGPLPHVSITMENATISLTKTSLTPKMVLGRCVGIKSPKPIPPEFPVPSSINGLAIAMASESFPDAFCRTDIIPLISCTPIISKYPDVTSVLSTSHPSTSVFLPLDVLSDPDNSKPVLMTVLALNTREPTQQPIPISTIRLNGLEHMYVNPAERCISLQLPLLSGYADVNIRIGLLPAPPGAPLVPAKLYIPTVTKLHLLKHHAEVLRDNQCSHIVALCTLCSHAAPTMPTNPFVVASAGAGGSGSSRTIDVSSDDTKGFSVADDKFFEHKCAIAPRFSQESGGASMKPEMDSSGKYDYISYLTKTLPRSSLAQILSLPPLREMGINTSASQLASVTLGALPLSANMLKIIGKSPQGKTFSVDSKTGYKSSKSTSLQSSSTSSTYAASAHCMPLSSPTPLVDMSDRGDRLSIEIRGRKSGHPSKSGYSTSGGRIIQPGFQDDIILGTVTLSVSSLQKIARRPGGAGDQTCSVSVCVGDIMCALRLVIIDMSLYKTSDGEIEAFETLQSGREADIKAPDEIPDDVNPSLVDSMGLPMSPRDHQIKGIKGTKELQGSEIHNELSLPFGSSSKQGTGTSDQSLIQALNQTVFRSLDIFSSELREIRNIQEREKRIIKTLLEESESLNPLELSGRFSHDELARACVGLAKGGIKSFSCVDDMVATILRIKSYFERANSIGTGIPPKSL
ncbi:hypothetical protein ADUPG1_006980 [Aduncisulcus paluster]|uniref:Uncharacterized protein n=1 Tax=Aduncisulcus paluster TaxID=2918883 RepID=A0ABQ5KLX2_9EUKA|nr:hypothetical protein ADUPG1_006980 [Aduncisulcus paluster]